MGTRWPALTYWQWHFHPVLGFRNKLVFLKSSQKKIHCPLLGHLINCMLYCCKWTCSYFNFWFLSSWINGLFLLRHCFSSSYILQNWSVCKMVSLYLDHYDTNIGSNIENIKCFRTWGLCYVINQRPKSAFIPLVTLWYSSWKPLFPP